MMLKRMILVVLIGILLAATAKDNSNKKKTSETDTIKLQYHRRLLSSLKLIPFESVEKAVVRYDPSGLGFEILLPGSFQYQHRPGFQPKPVKSLASSTYLESRSIYRESDHKLNNNKPKLPDPKPQYPDRYKSVHKLESVYPPHKSTNYQTKYTNYCPKVGGYEAQCRPIKDCAVWYDLVLATPRASCQLTDGYPGVCCPPIPQNGMFYYFGFE